MRFAALITAFMTLGLAQAADANLQALAKIQGESISSHEAGAWVKIKNAQGQELTITVKKKTQSDGGWKVTTEVAPGGEFNNVLGSVAELAKRPDPIVAMSEETLTLGDKKVACKVFTYKSGQKEWFSATIPAGGTAKVVGPNGEKFVTALSWSE